MTDEELRQAHLDKVAASERWAALGLIVEELLTAAAAQGFAAIETWNRRGGRVSIVVSEVCPHCRQLGPEHPLVLGEPTCPA